MECSVCCPPGKEDICIIISVLMRLLNITVNALILSLGQMQLFVNLLAFIKSFICFENSTHENSSYITLSLLFLPPTPSKFISSLIIVTCICTSAHITYLIQLASMNKYMLIYMCPKMTAWDWTTYVEFTDCICFNF